MRFLLILAGLVAPFFLLTSCRTKQAGMTETSKAAASVDSLRYPDERHIKNIRQLTFGGDNAEAYFSFNGRYLVFQSTNTSWGTACDQIFYMPLKGTEGGRPPMVSTGKGRTTCAYFLPGDKEVLYASTHHAGEECPEAPRVMDGKYVWPIFSTFDIFTANLKGEVTGQLTNTKGYDAEATLSPDGKRIVFTSDRTGDLELYTMNIDGSDVKQVTFDLGYDGGAFFSPDGKQLVFRASRPKTEEEINTYKGLLAKGLVQPTNMEIFVCNVDGSNLRQVTNLGKANWAPYFHPDGKRILFTSNHHSPGGRQFNLFIINHDGTGLKQLTYDGVFDAFPMFSRDGKQLVFASNRNNGGTRDTNVFIADWEE